MTVASDFHIHGWCRACKARRASRDTSCPVCFGLLEDFDRYDPHPPIEGTVAEIPSVLDRIADAVFDGLGAGS